jgi:arylsulfatase A-like enzyme
MYENSIKVPAIFSHPGRIPKDVVQDVMVSAYDFMPTLLDYLNLPQPEGSNSPGKSFLNVLLGKKERDERQEVIIFDEYGPVRMIRTKDCKYVYRNHDGPDKLYDLVNDPDERKNKINDPFQKERTCRMKNAMDKWFKKYVDPSRDGFKFTVTGCGQGKYLKLPERSHDVKD